MKKYYSTSVSFFKLLPIFFILFLSFVAFSIAGNPTTITDNVDLQITLSMSKHSGDNQYAAIQTALDDPFVVQVIDKNGNGKKFQFNPLMSELLVEDKDVLIVIGYSEDVA